MANRYWVGGTGTWDATVGTKWALTSGGVGGQAVPTAADDVYFDAASGAVTITLSGARTCLSFNSTGFTGTLTGTGTLAVSGNAIYGSGATFTNTGTWTFNATSGTQQITTNTKTLDFSITQNGVGGTVQLQDNLTMGSTRVFTLTNGALDLSSGNRTLSTGSFSSSNSNIRSIAFGTGNITLTNSNTTIFNISTATNFSYTGSPTFKATYSGSVGTRTIAQGTGSTTESNAVSCLISAGSDIISTASAGSYKTLDFTGFTGSLASNNRTLFGNLILSSGMTVTSGVQVTTFSATSGTQTITSNNTTFDNALTFNGIGGTFAFQDALIQGSTRNFIITNGTVQLKAGVTSTIGALSTSDTNQKFLQSTLAGTKATLSQVTGIVSVGYLTIKDINATGGATFNAYTVNNNVNAGNNIGWDFFAQLGKTIFTRRKEKRVLI